MGNYKTRTRVKGTHIFKRKHGSVPLTPSLCSENGIMRPLTDTVHARYVFYGN